MRTTPNQSKYLHDISKKKRRIIYQFATSNCNKMLLPIIFFFLYFIVNFSSTSVTDNDCIVNSSVYVNKVGECDEGYIHSGDKTKCLKIATGLTDSCEESQQCSEFLFPGGSCDNGICVCRTGYHYLHGQCWKSSILNETCNSSDECYVNFDIAAATCKYNICQCSDGYYQREYRSCRRRAQKVGDSCAIDLDCAFDKNQYHICNKTAGCVPKININSSRNVNFGFDEEKFKVESFPIILFNTNDKLVCERAHFYSEEKKICVAEIGELCSSNETALIKNSECSNNHTWNCKSIYAPINNRLCNKVTTQFNKSCLFNEQCYIFGPDTLCKNKRCVCNENSHFIEEELFCWINKQPGESCENDKDCFDIEKKMGLKCENKICICPVGTHLNSKKSCVKDVKAIGDSCTEISDCRSLAYTNCTNNICSCVENYFEQSGNCTPGLGTYCDQSVNCKTKNSYCNNGRCTCSYKYVAQSLGLCLPIRRYGELCEYSVQCNVTDSNLFCLHKSDSPMGICICVASYHYNYGKCFKQKVLGETCENIGDCYVESDPSLVTCFKGVCKCHENTNQLNETHCKNRMTQSLLSFWVLSATAVSKLFLNTLFLRV